MFGGTEDQIKVMNKETSVRADLSSDDHDELEWKRDPTMPTYEEWRCQVLGGLSPLDWEDELNK